MTTYTTITNAEIDQDSPITQPLMTALRDNPVAITEGAAGAPKIQAAALSTFVATAPATITGLDNFASISIRGGAFGGSAGGPDGITITMEFSDDGGSTWAASANLINITTATNEFVSINLDISVNLQTGSFSTRGVRANKDSSANISFSSASASGTVALPSGAVNAIRIANANGTAALNVYGG